jgi:hypothetical protein
MLPALYDLLLDHKAEFDYEANGRCSPPATGDATPSTTCAARSSTHRSLARTSCSPPVDNARSRAAPAHAAAHVRLDAGRDQPATPASDVPPRPRRSAPTSRVYQQVIDMGTAASRCSKRQSDARWTRPSHCFPAGRFATDCPPAQETPPSPRRGVGWKALQPLASGDFSEAAEGTRTLDLLHGKQTL